MHERAHSAHSWGIFGGCGKAERSFSTSQSLSEAQQCVLTLAVPLIRPVPAVVLLVALPAVGDAVPVPTLELVVPGAVRGFCWVFWQGEESPVSHRVTSAALSTAQRWEHLREHHPEQHKHISSSSSPAFPFLPALTLLPHCFVCVLRGQTPALMSEPEQNPPEHGRNGGANPATLK